MVIKLLILPLIAGLSYEFIKYAGKHDNILVKILAAPGLWMQRLTTKEPDDSQIEVAIKSLKLAMPDEFPNEEMLAPEVKTEASAESEEKPAEA
jgi:uncharacterized protein YqhQ